MHKVCIGVKRQIFTAATSFLFSVLILLLFSGAALAVPADPVDKEFVQPDGATFTARLRGDEHLHWVETASGYAIEKGEDGFWYYISSYSGDQPNLSSTRADESPEPEIQQGMAPSPSAAPESAWASSPDAPLAGSPAPFGPFNGKVLKILGYYDDKAPTYSASVFSDLQTQLNAYYNTVSHGKVTMSRASESHGASNDGVIGWLRLGSTRPSKSQIAIDAMNAADSYINFANYDADGDGYVDSRELSIVVVVAGYEASYDGGSATPNVWAHATSLTTPLQLDGKYVGGSHAGWGYVELGEIHGNHPATMGVVAHELGHLTFGLPDLYDTADDGTAGNGLMSWCLMSKGSWGGKTGEAAGATPVIPSAWARVQLGWETPMTGSSFSITAAGSARATASNSSFKAVSSLGTEYFLVDNRQDLGYDRGLERMAGTGFGGLAIYHVDISNVGNWNASRRGVDLEPADNNEILSYPYQTTDTWRAGPAPTQISFTRTSTPNSNLNNGSSSSVAITNISSSAEVMTAQSHSPVVTSVQPSGVIYSRSATINVSYADSGNDINPASVVVTLDGNALSGCTVTTTYATCPVNALLGGIHIIGGSVADYAGASTLISGSFNVSQLILGLTSRLSTASDGTQGNGSSFSTSAVFADNKSTIFASQASNLISDDTNSVSDVFIKNNEDGSITGVTSDSFKKSDGLSDQPAVAGDGSSVVFSSTASNLSSSSTNGKRQILRKTGSGFQLVSTGTLGKGNGDSTWPSASNNGDKIAFASIASNLVATDTNGKADIFVKDMQSGSVTQASTDGSIAHLPGNGDSDKPVITGDGKYVFFRSAASNLVSGDTNGKWDIFRKDISGGGIICLTCSGNGDAGWPSISTDGRYVTFPSDATNLVSGGSNGQRHIYRVDTGNGNQIQLVSTDAGGAQANGSCAAPSISDNGRYVAYRSEATNLVAGDTNNVADVLIKDMQTGASWRYSKSTSGVQSSGGSDYPDISGDGTYVSFASEANNLVPGDTNNIWDLFLTSKTPPVVTNVQPSGILYQRTATVVVDYTDAGNDINTSAVTVTLNGSALSGCTVTGTRASCSVSELEAGAYSIGGSVTDLTGDSTPVKGSFYVSSLTIGLTSRDSTDANGVQGNGDSNSTSDVSADNNYTVFASDATNLVSGDTNGKRDVFIKDNRSGAITRVSTNSSGAQATGGDSDMPRVSTDGRFVVFSSTATNLVSSDSNGKKDVFLKDTQTGTTTRISIEATGLQQANGDSDWPVISGDGRYVAFSSDATNLQPTDSNNKRDVFYKDRQTGLVYKASTDSLGQSVNGESGGPGQIAISADGQYVAFRSDATNLVPGDDNGKSDVFRKSTQNNGIIRVSTDSAGAQAGDGSWDCSMSADGRYVAFDSAASNLVPGDTNTSLDVFRKDLQSGQTIRVSVTPSGAQADNWSWSPSISSDGRYVALLSSATNVVSGDTNGKLDVFRKDLQTNEVKRYSTSSNGVQANGDSGYPAISANGAYVTFVSFATNLVLNDSNNKWDVFLSSKA